MYFSSYNPGTIYEISSSSLLLALREPYCWSNLANINILNLTLLGKYVIALVLVPT